MSRKASPTAIGAFVIVAISLVVLGIVLLSPDVGEDRQTYQLFFEGSVKGLDVGAPVLVKGVRVGRVRTISLRMDSDAQSHTEYVVPVTVEISRRRLLSSPSGDETNTVAELIDSGLRARLELDSFVTQKLFVELGFHPDTEARFHSQSTTEYQQIPTVQTGWQELQADLADVDIVQLAAKASSALDGINRILNGPEAIQTLDSLAQSLASLNTLISGLDQDRTRLSESIELTLSDLRTTSADARASLQQMERLLQSGRGLSEDTRQLVQQLEGTLDHVDQVAQNLSMLSDADSPTVYRADVALEEVTEAARSLRQFLEMLERKPEALIRGR